MTNKKIIVCGDSFCSSHTYERDHFSQILEDDYGYNVINLARGGISTVAIGFQIQRAISIRPDVIVYNKTMPGRIEVPINGKKFQPDLGLKNFSYPFENETSCHSEHVGDKHAPILSTMLGLLIDNPKEYDALDKFFDYPLEKGLRQAVEMYITYMYDDKLNETVNHWIYGFWHRRIVEENILPVPMLKDNFGQVAYDFSKKTNHSWPKCYHTDRATQETLAKSIDSIIKDSI